MKEQRSEVGVRTTRGSDRIIFHSPFEISHLPLPVEI